MGRQSMTLSAELNRISRLVQQKSNVDQDLWRLFQQHQSPQSDDPQVMLKSSQKKFVILTLCSLITTKFKFSMQLVLEAVESCDCNPKLAYAALTYYRLSVRPMNTFKSIAFRLLMMLDASYMVKSPVNKLPSILTFTELQVQQLRAHHPSIQWQCDKPRDNITSASEFEPFMADPTGYDLVATLGPNIVRELAHRKSLSSPYKLLFQCRLHDPKALAGLRRSTDLLLLVHCCSLWFSHDQQFIDCPVAYKFCDQWVKTINTIVERLIKQDSLYVFEQVPNGVLIAFAFFTIMRPSNLPVFDTPGSLKVWVELFNFVFTGSMDYVFVKNSLHLLTSRGRLVALDILIRGDNDISLVHQFLTYYEPGIVDVEPVQALLLQRGLVKLAGALGAVPYSDETGTEPQQVLKIIHRAHVSSITGIIGDVINQQRAIGRSSALFERLLPLINTLSIRGTGVMVKLEYTSMLLTAILMQFYAHIGFIEGATQMALAGGARAKGLGAHVWCKLFGATTGTASRDKEEEEEEEEEHVSQLRTTISQLTNLGADDETLSSTVIDLVKQMRKDIRQNVLLNTIGDTVLTIPDSCSSDHRPRRWYDPSKVIESWKVLETSAGSLDWRKTQQVSQLVVDSAPLVSVLGKTPYPYFARAADNLRTPILSSLSSTTHPSDAFKVQRANDIVVTINFSNSKNALVVTRNLRGSSIALQIPLYRPNLNMEDQLPFCAEDVVQGLKGLISQSTNLSRAEFSGNADEWWRQQRRFGKQARECLETLESRMFGGFIGLLSGISLVGTSTLLRARSDITKIYQRFLPEISKNALTALKDEVIDLFLEPSKQKYLGFRRENQRLSHLVAELNGFVLDALRLGGNDIDYDMIDLIELEHSLLTVVCSYEIADVEQKHLVLIPDSYLCEIPWESMRYFDHHLSASRCLSFWHYLSLVESAPAEIEGADGGGESDTEPDDDQVVVTACDHHRQIDKDVYYILNPQNDLPAAQELFSTDFKVKNWQGVCGQQPSEKQLISKLGESSCYIYIGHGSGHRMIRGSLVRRLEKCGAVMLFGCSSARLKGDTVLAAGPVIDYALAGCRLFVGFMWDVPNTDCNLFTQEFLDLCFNQRYSPFQAMKRARRVCRIYTTSLSPVIYGIP